MWTLEPGAWVQIPPLLLFSCVALVEFLACSVPQFPPPAGGHHSTNLRGLQEDQQLLHVEGLRTASQAVIMTFNVAVPKCLYVEMFCER